MTLSKQVFTVGDCPVTPGIEHVYILMNAVSEKPVFYCPDCGCAWDSLPGLELNEVNTLQEIAPDGVRLPNEEEIRRLRSIFVLTPETYDEWVDKVVKKSSVS